MIAMKNSRVVWLLKNATLMVAFFLFAYKKLTARFHVNA